MGSLISLITIVFLSIIITKIGAHSLIKTGLDKGVAQFQARSAFTGVGFTTKESEKITNQPVRRKIVMALMLIGNIGVVSAIASLMLTFIEADLDTSESLLRLGLILLLIAVLWLLSKSRWLELQLTRMIDWALIKFTTLHNKDYVAILKLQKEYEITVITVGEDDWLADKKIADLNLSDEGINLIAIERKDGTYLGTPQRENKVKTGDKLTVYGREENLKNLEKRKKSAKGEAEHQSAKEEQAKQEKKQKQKDKSNK